MKYKALFLDIDDTFVEHFGTVSEVNRLAIEKAQKAGVFVTVATGRVYHGAVPIWKVLNIQGPIIVCGGAVAIDTRTEEKVFEDLLPVELVREVLDYCHELGIHAQIYDNDIVVAEEENAFTRRYIAPQDLTFRAVPNLRGEGCFPTPKILGYVDPSVEDKYTAIFKERFGDRIQVASTKPGYLELNQLNCNKGTAMLRVAKMLGIKQEEIAAMGDNTLDLEMLRAAALSGCVANGKEVVKQVADVVAPACNENGVAWFIEHYILD